MEKRNWLKTYFNWLHLSVPAGVVEPLPEAGPEGETKFPGVWISGDLTGIPLLKTAADSGAQIAEKAFQYLRSHDASDLRKQDAIDLCIIGGGVSGISCALRAKELGMSFRILESSRPYHTIHDFPSGKPIFLYPKDRKLNSSLPLSGDTKESLIACLEKHPNVQKILQENLLLIPVSHIQPERGIYAVISKDSEIILKAKTICIAIGKSGDYKRLGIPGEDLPKVFNQLQDPRDFTGKRVIVIGGGDSALETAISLAENGANVSLSYRKDSFSRAKPENVEKFLEFVQSSRIQFYPSTVPVEIRDSSVVLKLQSGETLAVKNDIVFSMIGRSAPLEFFRKSGIPVSREWNFKRYLSLALILTFCILLYHWKLDGSLVSEFFRKNGFFPFALESWRSQFHPREGFLYILATNLVSPSFYYSLAYTLVVGIFGIRRIRRRPTAYIKFQTLVLCLFQLVPLFLLPFFILPYLGFLGVWDSGWAGWIADEFFPKVDYGLGREYWRAFGLILAWPLFIWNVFTGSPMWGWLILSFVQTFAIIPLIVWRWGKGAYCGWICSCGALAETLGDSHRKKMPHGPFWNRLNLLGQGILCFALVLLLLRFASWFLPGSIAHPIQNFFYLLLSGWYPLSYYYLVDLWLAGILGVGLYFHFSGRTWCRFACPLAALMHIYAKFSQFRIFSEKKKCISCNICTSVCHQGIDVMSYANKGLPMNDPQCVRCSACVVNCPTEVLHFGRIDPVRGEVYDKLRASLVGRD